MTCSRANVRCTTIGVFAFHFCVRNGYRWFCKAIVTGRILLTYPQALFSLAFKRSLFRATNPPCFPGLYGQASRVISTGWLHPSRGFHLRPIYVFVLNGPFGACARDDSSWGLLPA